jgi:predicted nucleotidyltransferase
VKAAVSATREALASSFGDRCLAVYLMGSLARGGFSESVSDIDLGVVIAGPLEPSDSDRIALSAERGVAGDSVLPNAVSIFWGSVDSISGRGGGGRFPPFDRLDLLESAVLLHGRELREELVRPQQRELVVSSASFALQRLCSEASIENLGSLERIASGGLVSLTKTVLFAPRFVYLAQTGKVAANDAAAAHYCAQFSGPDAELVGCAVRWRSTPPPPTPAVVDLLRLGLVPLYVRFLDVYLPRLEAYDEPELAAGLRRWRAQLLPRLAEGRGVPRRVGDDVARP